MWVAQTEGQTAVAQWMKAGGNLMTVTGAAGGDRYHQPATVISSATGITEVPRPRKMIQWTSKLAAADTGTGDLCGHAGSIFSSRLAIPPHSLLLSWPHEPMRGVEWSLQRSIHRVRRARERDGLHNSRCQAARAV